jgi:hypothetical protein
MTRQAIAAGIAVVVVVVAALAGAWFARDSALLRPVAAWLGVPPADATQGTAKSLAAAGVHKCRVGARVVYADQPCPAGSRELAANGGTVTVVSFPKPAPGAGIAPTLAAVASGVASGALIQGMGQAEVDRMRDKLIQQAGDR